MFKTLAIELKIKINKTKQKRKKSTVTPLNSGGIITKPRKKIHLENTQGKKCKKNIEQQENM